MHIPCLIITCCAFLAQIIYTVIKMVVVYKNIKALSETTQTMDENERVTLYRKESLPIFYKVFFVNIILLIVGIIATLLDGVSNLDKAFVGEILEVAIIFWFVVAVVFLVYAIVCRQKYCDKFLLKTVSGKVYVRTFCKLVINIATTIAVNFGLILYSFTLLLG